MKKSHRKDVIIARVIFAALVVIVVALIALLIAVISSRGANTQNSEAKTTESEYVPNYTEADTETETMTETESQTTETESQGKTQVWVTGNEVNVREEATTNSSVLKTVSPSDVIYLLEDQPTDGFYKVETNGTIGYITEQYLTKENPNP